LPRIGLFQASRFHQRRRVVDPQSFPMVKAGFTHFARAVVFRPCRAGMPPLPEYRLIENSSS
jgi:hypothetical protein